MIGRSTVNAEKRMRAIEMTIGAYASISFVAMLIAMASGDENWILGTVINAIVAFLLVGWLL